MKTNREKITLPVSGATCVVVKYSASDFMEYGQEIPIAYPSEEKTVANEPNKAGVINGIRAMQIAMLKCCSPLTFPDGSRKRIVAKDLDQIGVNEISPHEIDDTDAIFIAQNVARLSGLNVEVGAQAQKFPEEQAGNVHAVPDSQDIPQATE